MFAMLDRITWLVLDVDGVLTDGSLLFGPADATGGDAYKFFHVRDGAALQQWRKQGYEIVWVSGRSGKAVAARAKELGIALCFTGVIDKWSVLQSVLQSAGESADRCVFVGDDWIDLDVMSHCGFSVATSDAAPAARKAAHWITRNPGGRGAVAEVVEYILRKQNRWRPTASGCGGAHASAAEPLGRCR